MKRDTLKTLSPLIIVYPMDAKGFHDIVVYCPDFSL